MKAADIKLEKEGFNMSTTSWASGSHYKSTMKWGRLFPCSKAQALFFTQKRVVLSVLNMDDVENIEGLLGKHGFTGEYRYTRSKQWVRLQNHDDLYKALRAEYVIGKCQK